MLVLGAGLGVYCAREPWVWARKHESEALAARQGMNRALADQIEVQSDLSEVESPGGRERQARERGFVRRGEAILEPGG